MQQQREFNLVTMNGNPALRNRNCLSQANVELLSVRLLNVSRTVIMATAGRADVECQGQETCDPEVMIRHFVVVLTCPVYT